MDRTEGMNLIKLDKESEILELKDSVILRISEIVETLTEDNEIFESVDRSRLMNFLSLLAGKSPEKLLFITDEELTKRVRRITGKP